MRSIAPAAAPGALATLTLAVALAALGATACAAPTPPPLTPIPAATAAPLPPLEYPLRNGETWASSTTLGRVLILDAWATYCPSCRQSFPKLSRLAATHPKVVVIGVSVDEDDAEVDTFLREVPVEFAIARDPQQTIGSGPLAVTRLPTLLVVDRLGRVRFRGDPMAEADYDRLPGLITALLAE